MGVIYKIVNTINGKIYIGQTINFINRKRSHKANFKRFNKSPETHKSGCRYLYNAFNKYGFENFSFHVIEECENKILTEREQYWLDFYKSYEYEVGYNLAKIANSSLGVKHTEKTKKKLSEISKKRIGEKNTFYGKKHTEETKNKIRQKKLGSKMPPSFLKKWSEHKIWELNKKEILQYDIWGNFIKKWESLNDVENQLLIKIGRISECLHGKQPTAGGYIWKFMEKDYPNKIDANISSSSFIRNFKKYYS